MWNPVLRKQCYWLPKDHEIDQKIDVQLFCHSKPYYGGFWYSTPMNKSFCQSASFSPQLAELYVNYVVNYLFQNGLFWGRADGANQAIKQW